MTWLERLSGCVYIGLDLGVRRVNYDPDPELTFVRPTNVPIPYLEYE